MAVRIRIGITPQEPGGEPVESISLLNGGFESESPCILLPVAVAAKLLRKMPEEGDRILAEVAGGKATFFFAEDTLNIHVVTQDRRGPAVECNVIVSKGDREILVSDLAIDALGVKIESFGKGLWRFSDEEQQRTSEPAQYW